jgi:hypothetical protein
LESVRDENMNSERVMRDQAWVGDAVLALYARRWLLRHTPKKMSDADRQQLFELFVSNQFLSSFGEPSQVEAAIGRRLSRKVCWPPSPTLKSLFSNRSAKVRGNGVTS